MLPIIHSGLKAINERGVAEATLQVAILGPGTPPDQISVRPVQDGFRVHWQAPSVPNGDVTNYILYGSRDPDAELSDWVGPIQNQTIKNILLL